MFSQSLLKAQTDDGDVSPGQLPPSLLKPICLYPDVNCLLLIKAAWRAHGCCYFVRFYHVLRCLWTPTLWAPMKKQMPAVLGCW